MDLFSIIKNLFLQDKNLNKTDPINYWVNDPSTNLTAITSHKDSILPLKIHGYKGGGYKINTSEGRAANCHAIINNCLENYKNHIPQKWFIEKHLNIYPLAGVDLNAYYDRKSIKYFYYYDNLSKKNTYSCESADIVSHELGHAILDTIRPDFWNVQSYEIWALHEFFGDIIAILNIINNEDILKIALKETKSNLLMKSNTISRLAEQFAKTLYNATQGKMGHDPSSLRDALNEFSYVDPKQLPDNGPSKKLSRECHSFSRILTGCFYEILIEIYNLEKSSASSFDAMQTAKNVVSNYLFNSIKAVPCTNKIFKSLCQKVIQIDKKMGSKYLKILIKVFEKRNLLTNYNKINIQNYEEVKEKTKNLKINYNNLSLNVEVPVESRLEYNEDGSPAVLSYENFEETVEIASMCVDTLYKSNMINNSFLIKKNNLIREKIIN